ncbi:MAG: hypothetical protein H6625_11510 [Bdellovibrionaceae bacterium]|nr:hypothetical protein [Pseudobdellovibrionaceae bacterium]
MKLSLLSILLFFSFEVLAYSKKSQCSITELSLKNCPLNIYNYRLHFLNDKILIHDGVWRTIEKMPLVGEKTDWEKIKINKIGNKVYVEFYIWTEPFGETEVQSLMWFIHIIDNNKMTQLAVNVVQKRNRDFDSSTKSYKFDKAIAHQLLDKKNEAYLVIKGKEKKF